MEYDSGLYIDVILALIFFFSSKSLDIDLVHGVFIVLNLLLDLISCNFI